MNTAHPPVQPPPSGPEEVTSSAAPSFMPAAIGHSLPAPKLAEQVARNVARAGFPEINETILAVETERAIAQIRGGTPLPLDADASKADGYFLADLSEKKAATLRLERLITEADERCWTARHALAQLMPPLSPRTWAALVGALFVITLIGVYALKALLSSSFDEQLFRAYYEGLTVADAELVSARQAETLVMLAASFLLGGKALAVVGSSGKLSVASKVLLAAVALVFSAALAAVRLSDGGGFAAVAVSLVELALLGSYTLLLLAIGDVLQGNAVRAVTYRAAQGVVAVEEAHRADLEQARTAAIQEFETRRRALAQREDDCRRLPLNEAVARATVEAEYLVATAELMTTTAEAVYGDAPAVSRPREEQPGGVP